MVGLINRQLILGIFATLVFVSFGVGASTIVPAPEDATQIKVVSPESGSMSDILTIKKPNASGISINRFLRLDIDRPLKIINVPADTSQATEKAASLVILVVNAQYGPIIQSDIEIVGPATDLIIITDNAGSVSGATVENTIQCLGCSVHNIYRLTFAAALTAGPLRDYINQLQDYDSVNEVGVIASYAENDPLSTTNFSQAVVSNLYAPGALSVEIIAEQVQISGGTTHQRVDKSSAGGYESNLNGDYLMGGGQTQLVVGSVSYDYEEQKVLGFIDDGHQGEEKLTQSGVMQTTSLVVYANRRINMNGSVNTSTDLTSTVRYKNKIQSAMEGINIASFHESALLMVGGSLTSNGPVQLSSAGRLILGGGKVTSPEVTLIAKNDMLSKAEVQSSKVNVAAGNVVNKNTIIGQDTIQIWSDQNIINEYGGVLSAPTVKIQAEKGIVRNGARCAAVNLVGTDIQYAANCSSYLNVAEEVLDSSKSMTIGTASASWGTTENENIGGSKPTETYAHILGNRVNIRSAALENINPYWKHVNEEGNVELDRQYINQVSISAEDELFIENTEYTINSSAIMRVNSEYGLLSIDTGVLNNERFRVVSLLDHVSIESQQTTEGDGVTIHESATANGYTLNVFTYSPPGYINSMGDFQIRGNGFLNNTAYFEVYGDARFAVGKVNVIGVQLTALEQNSLAFKTVIDNDCAANYSTWNLSCATFTMSNESLIIPPTLDSLFFVQGDAIGSEDMLLVKNAKPFDQFITSLKENIWTELKKWEADSRAYEESIRNGTEWWQTNTYENDGVLSLQWIHRYIEGCWRISCSTSQSDATRSISIWDRLAALYQTALAYIQDIWDNIELDWWN